MKFLAVIALLTFALAEASLVPEHTLRGPRFEQGRVYDYDLELNVTAGILGLSSQVSAAVLRAEVNIYAKTEKDFVLKVENVITSGSVKAIDSKYGDIPLRLNQDLQNRLSQPIKFTLEDGKVKSYTLSNNENLESKKIKKSILRSLEMYIPESAMQELETHKTLNIPVTYNRTEETEFGFHISQYMITSSPYAHFPSNRIVYNISRIDNCEGERYPAHKLHHNFQKQGCAEVCKKDWRSNEYAAGCPIGYEPHQSPIKAFFSHQHDLSFVGNALNPEVIRTIEVHIAKMYDQDMEVLFRYQLSRSRVTVSSISVPSGQKTYTDLHDMESEIHEKEIEDLCYSRYSKDNVTTAKNLLTKISKLIVKGDLESDESSFIGEKVILLRDVLAKLNVDDLQSIAKNIKSITSLPRATDEEKVARQIWLNILPTVGTTESVIFIARYVKDQSSLLKWEAKEILEALPQNIERPGEEEIRALWELTDTVAQKNHHLHSAVFLSLARVIGKMCGHLPVIRSTQKPSSTWFNTFQAASESKPYHSSPKCPEAFVSEIVQNVIRKLRSTHKPEEMVIFIETLSHIGVPDALCVISEYIYGTADNIQEFSPKFADFMKTVSLFALHNMAGKYPEEVLQVALPVFFNETETAKVRNAAFGVVIRCQPPLDVLEKIAIHSWFEKSNEVGSYVTSTLETFGNSSLPCMQLTAHRIKVVLPQFRRFDIGLHHAKNYFWSYFDDLREFGLETRFEYVPNNESFIPSVLYKSISYSMDSLRDIVFQASFNGEGLTQENIMEKINEYFKIPSIPTIEDEARVFGEGNDGLSFIKPRIPEGPRFTAYHRMFYQSSYNYLDSSTYRQAKDDIMEVFAKYLKSADRSIKGYLVKLMIPSSYHTVSIAKTLPYPVEFQMRQPVIFVLNVKNLARKPPTHDHFNLYFKPSVYLSKLFTHQVKNLGDCKEVGSYHEHKIAASYPFEVKYRSEVLPNATIRYKVPNAQGKILTYFTESGTYAGKKEPERLPSSEERKPIRIHPAPYKFEKELRIVGFPALHVELSTEDMNIFRHKLPRNPMELLDMTVKRILNAGWRHKSVNITFLEDHSFWNRDTEVTFNIKYHRQHIPSLSGFMESPQDQSGKWSRSSQTQWQSSNDENIDWSKYLRPSNDFENIDIPAVIERARQASRLLNFFLPHMSHILNVSVETEPQRSTAYFRMEYNHTYDDRLHTVHMDTAANVQGEEHTYKMSLDHVIGFWFTPDEFAYDSNYGKQEAGFITALSFPRGGDVCPWEKVEMISKGILKYVSNKRMLEKELLGSVHDKYFLPENHEQCLEDMKRRQPLSDNCVKVVRELSAYNMLRMTVSWKDKLPKSLRQFFRTSDFYLKHALFEHLNVTEEENMEKSIRIDMDYIDEFVDEPVIDFKLMKPSETVMLQRLPAGRIHALSSIYNIFDNHLLEATNNSYPPTCILMDNHVKTFDLETYPFSPEDCHYVLSTHCTKRKNFAIVLYGRKEIHMYAGSNSLILTPKRSSRENYVIKYNDERREVKDTILFDSEDEIYAYTESYERNHEHLNVVAKKAGIKLIYDGKIIKLMVDPRYKGELCGLCSEFDGEKLREFRGMDRCLYQDHVDFANSAMVKRNSQCRVKHFNGERICDSEEYMPLRGRGTTKRENYEPSIKRNIVITKGDEICFSVNPVPVCEGDDSPTETEYQQIGFHCLPKRDVTARRLANEAKWRQLEELEKKSIDYEDSIEVPKMC